MKPTLVVLAAGMGSRYGGLKQLDPMGPSGETILDYSVFDALRAGFGKVVFVIRRDFEQAFEEKVASRYKGRTPLSCAFQDIDDLPGDRMAPKTRTKPWGTSHAIWSARKQVREPFLAINADDFYGAESYQILAEHLVRRDQKEFAMGGFRLGGTLSGHGSVSRGVCTVSPEGLLSGIREFTRIEKTAGGATHFEPDGCVHQFTGEEVVSMNFWGFTPKVFDLLEDSLAAFFDEEGNDPGKECYIPTSVQQWIASGAARARVLETPSRWFGVTYREDRTLVEVRLADLVRQNLYPTPLWKA